MLDAARESLSFIEGRSRQELAEDRLLLLAVVKEIEIIGEAAGQISPETRAEATGIPWPKIIAMRNRSTHESGAVVGPSVHTPAFARRTKSGSVWLVDGL
jgi:uncharacterized protein with HEPN domain